MGYIVQDASVDTHWGPMHPTTYHNLLEWLVNREFNLKPVPEEEVNLESVEMLKKLLSGKDSTGEQIR